MFKIDQFKSYVLASNLTRNSTKNRKSFLIQSDIQLVQNPEMRMLNNSYENIHEWSPTRFNFPLLEETNTNQLIELLKSYSY